MQDVAQEKVVELVEKLEGVAPHVWEVLVRQQIIEGVMGASLILVIFVGAFTCIWKGSRLQPARGNCRAWDDHPGWAVSSFAFGIAALFALIILFADTLPHLLNPEYYALMDLLP